MEGGTEHSLGFKWEIITVILAFQKDNVGGCLDSRKEELLQRTEKYWNNIYVIYYIWGIYQKEAKTGYQEIVELQDY